jgi:hypothetical protein
MFSERGGDGPVKGSPASVGDAQPAFSDCGSNSNGTDCHRSGKRN